MCVDISSVRAERKSFLVFPPFPFRLSQYTAVIATHPYLTTLPGKEISSFPTPRTFAKNNRVFFSLPSPQKLAFPSSKQLPVRIGVCSTQARPTKRSVRVRASDF